MSLGRCEFIVFRIQINQGKLPIITRRIPCSTLESSNGRSMTQVLTLCNKLDTGFVSPLFHTDPHSLQVSLLNTNLFDSSYILLNDLECDFYIY